MAGNVDKVQLQVEVVRTQLDKLIKDVNSLKDQKIKVTVDSSRVEGFGKNPKAHTLSVKTLRPTLSARFGKQEIPSRTQRKKEVPCSRTSLKTRNGTT